MTPRMFTPSSMSWYPWLIWSSRYVLVISSSSLSWPGPVEVQQVGDVEPGVGGTEDDAAYLLLPHGQLEEVDAALGLGLGCHAGDDAGSALAREREGIGHEIAVHHAGHQDDGVGHLTPGELSDQGYGLLHGPRRMCGAEVEGRLLLELDRVHGNDVLGPGHAGALDGVDANAADADHDDGLARA